MAADADAAAGSEDAAAAAGDAVAVGGGGTAATEGAFAGVTRALERLFPTTAGSAAPALGLLPNWCALQATLGQQRDEDAAAGLDASHNETDNGDGGAISSDDGGGGGGDGSEPAHRLSHKIGPRPLAALEALVGLAEDAAGRAEPLLWGWCR